MTVDFASFLDCVMCFFGGGIGHSQLPVDQRHAELDS
jgi:hypothetical protein